MADQGYLEQLLSAQFNYMKGYYTFALDQFNALLQEKPDHYETGLYRAMCNLNLGNFDDLAGDGEKLITLNSNRYEGLYLKATALFEKRKLDEAKTQIERAKLLVQSLDAADAKRVKVEALARKIEALDTSKMLVKAAPKKATTTKSAYHPQSGKVTYSWIQFEKEIELTFKWGLKDQNALKVEYKPETMSIEFPTVEDKKYSLTLHLYDDIIPEKCRHKVLMDKIQVTLAKKEPEEWALLEVEDSPNERVLESQIPKAINQPQRVTQTQEGPSYPSSAKVKRDWSKIDKEIEEDMEKNRDDYQQGDPTNAMFQMLYKNADENTRRAMMKSYQTSGGTVLSMNWDEVKQKDYEGNDRPDAPDGQEWRKWEK